MIGPCPVNQSIGALARRDPQDRENPPGVAAVARRRGLASAPPPRASAAAFRRALAFVLAPALAGCAVGPSFTPPVAPVAENLESHNPSVKSDRQDYRDWWKAFHDPVLDRLIETAYDQNLTLLSAGTRVLQARAELGVAVGEFYPQQQGGYGLTTYNRPSHADAAANPQLQLNNFWQSQLGLKAAWELDFWGKFRRGVESADAAYLASIASYDDVLVTLLGSVAKTYIGIRTLEKQIIYARENIVRQKQALQIAHDRFSGGTATKLDVYQAENVLGQTEASVPQLTVQLQHGANALRVLLGMPPEPLGSLLGARPAKSPSRRRKSSSAFRPISCAAAPTFAPPN